MSPIFLMSLLFLLTGPAPSIAQLFALRSITIQPFIPLLLSCLAWDPTGRHFIAGSSQGPTLYAISDAGVVEHLLTDSNNTGYFVASVAIDHVRERLIVAFSTSSSVAAYDLNSYQKISELPLPQLDGNPGGVAVDLSNGDVFVTSSSRGIVMKVRLHRYGSTVVSKFNITEDQGLGGTVHVNDDHNPYILVVQATTGKIFKVGSQDGIVKEVLSVGKSRIPATKGHTIALHSDLSLTFVGDDASIRFMAIFGKSSRSAFYYDRSLRQRGQAISATVRDGTNAYVLIKSPDSYSIVEMDWGRMWIIYVVIYIALLHFVILTAILFFMPLVILYIEQIRIFHDLEG